MLESKNEKTINGNSYSVGCLAAMHNYSLFLKVSAIVGDALGDITESLLGGTNASYRTFGDAVNKLVSSLYVNDPDGKLILEIMSQTRRNGAPINKDSFNNFYMGNMGEMVEALIFTFEVHFKHFFPKSLLSGLQIKSEEVKGDSVVN